jgi:hypothetical protein
MPAIVVNAYECAGTYVRTYVYLTPLAATVLLVVVEVVSREYYCSAR